MPLLPTLDLGSLPASEDDKFEYKSSATAMLALRDKIGKAASGFWNSGGGVFVVGVDGTRKPDGGIAKTVGVEKGEGRKRGGRKRGHYSF
jgi:hypothetical protein